MHRANDDQTVTPRRPELALLGIALLSNLTACANGERPLSQPEQVLAARHAASRYMLVHSFEGPPADGWVPMGGLVSDASGRMYGVTNYGGSHANTCNVGVGCGTFFTLDPSSLTETILYSFGSTPDDSQLPNSLFVHNGSFYGTAQDGGSSGAGTVFELNPPAHKNQPWRETILYGFHYNGHDGSDPIALTVDAAGAIYGATGSGGGSTKCALGCGTIFELVPPAMGKRRWREAILHSFNLRDGAAPNSLVLSSNATLYGETGGGGSSSACGKNGCGTVFTLKRGRASSRWLETILHSFTEHDGWYPYGGLVTASDGTLYGITSYGGVQNCNPGSPRTGCGTVFALRQPGRHAGWIESTLYEFSGRPSDGGTPDAIITDGGDGFYGTTVNGGAAYCRYDREGCGTIFHLTPARQRAKWRESIDHSFSGGSGDGWDAGGALSSLRNRWYGATLYGGSGPCAMGCGTLYEFRP